MAVEFEVEEPIGSVGLFRVVRLGVVYVLVGALGGPDRAVYFDHAKASVLLLLEFHLVIVADNDARDIFLSRLPLVVLEGADRPVPGVDEEIAVVGVLMHIIGVVVIFHLVLLVLLHLLLLNLFLCCVDFVFSGRHWRHRLLVVVRFNVQSIHFLCKRLHLVDGDIVDVGIERDVNRCARFSRTSLFYKKQECFRLLIILIENRTSLVVNIIKK